MLSVVNEKDMLIEGKIDEKVLKRSTTVENSLQITPFYAKQTQFKKCKMNIYIDMASNYGNLYRCLRPKNKPNSNPIKPIQTQFNPKQTQFKPISKPNKPNLSKGQK